MKNRLSAGCHLILWLLPLLAAAGADDPTPIDVALPDRPGPVSFARDVSGFLAEKCVGCHSAALAENGLNLEEVAGMRKGGKRGPALVAGKADDSLLFRMAAHRVAPVMPPEDKKEKSAPLTPDELGRLKRWIDAGAADDSDEEAEPPAIELAGLPPGVQPVNAIDITPDGRLVAAGRGNLVALYDAETGSLIAALDGHRDIIQSIRFRPDGKRLAAGGYRTVTLWDIPTAPPGSGPTPVALELGPHVGRVLALDFSPDGRLLATGGGDPSRSGEVIVWDTTDGTRRLDLTSLHSDTVCAIRFSPDGTRLATASADKFVKVVNLTDGKEIRSFEGHTGHALAVDWKPDGKELVSGGADNALKLWDVEAGEPKRALQAAGKQVTAVRWVANKPLIAGAAGDAMVRYWDPEKGGVVRAFAGATDYAYCVAASADGTRIVGGCADGTILLWNGENGQLLRKLGPATKP